jgi:hypothetical protein
MISANRLIALVVVLFEVGVSNLQASDQDAILEGAKKEGVLVVYTSMSVDQAQRILDVFKTRYPFLKTTMFRAVGERLLTKIMTEAQAGKYDFDAVQSAESQAYFLKKKNLLKDMYRRKRSTFKNRSSIRTGTGRQFILCPTSSLIIRVW